MIFAGKAHPADEPGKGLLRRLHELSHDPMLRDHVVLLEDHDMNVSRASARGLRPVAQQPAPSPGGLRHQRHEGGVQRHAQLSRSSTGGGTRRTPRATASRTAMAKSTSTPRFKTGTTRNHCKRRCATASSRPSTNGTGNVFRSHGCVWRSTPCRHSRGATTRTAWSSTTHVACTYPPRAPNGPHRRLSHIPSVTRPHRRQSAAVCLQKYARHESDVALYRLQAARRKR